MSEPQNGRGALFAGGLAAILASTCCLGPLVLVALGFSGAWIGNLTVLEPYRPLFIDRNLNPQKTKKAPQNGCFFNTPCAP
ncbi:mercuric transporter MerT family protein, partial [Escherichia coli]